MGQRTWPLSFILLALTTCRETVAPATTPRVENPQSVSVLTQHNDNTRAGWNDNETALTTSNVNVPGGRIESGPINETLRIEGRAVDPDRLGEIVVRQLGDHPIRVRDVAEIVDSEEDAETAASRNGTPAIALSVRKQSGTNTVAVVDGVIHAVGALQATLPSGYSVDVVRDNAVQIRTGNDPPVTSLRPPRPFSETGSPPLSR